MLLCEFVYYVDVGECVMVEIVEYLCVDCVGMFDEIVFVCCVDGE